MKILLTYDVSKLDREVKHTMIVKGYSDFCTDTNQITYYLPKGTLWRKNISPATAIVDITKITKAFGAKLERALAVEFTGWDAIPGLKPKTKE